MLPLSIRACGITILLSLATTALAQAPVNISHEVVTMLDLPNAAGAYGHTLIADRNIHGLTVGGLTGSGLALQEGSFFVTFTPAGPVATLFYCGPDVLWTMVRAVNRHGAMVGWCYVREGDVESVHGFYRSESSKMTRLRYPGARYTDAMDLNDSHIVVGWYENPAGDIHGYRWTRSTGKFEQLDAPVAGAVMTIPTAINTAGHIAASVYTPTATLGVLLRNGQWTPVTVPGTTGIWLEDLTDQGALLGIATMPDQTGRYFFLEQGVAVTVKPALAQVEWSAPLALTPQRQTVGYLTTTIPARNLDAGDVDIIVDQGFLAPLAAVLGEPLTPPAPQMAARMRTVAPATPEAPTPVIQHDGCPDEPVPAGMRRVGKLALSWVGCARLRGK